MAVVSVKESWVGRGGADSFTKHRTFTRTYIVYTDNPNDNAAIAGGTSLLPRLGNPYPYDPAAIVVGVRPAQDESDPRRWIVTIEYDTQPEFPSAQQVQPDGAADPGGDPGPGNSTSPGEMPENPLDRPPVWKLSFQQTSEVARTALNFTNPAFGPPVLDGSKPIRNSAKLPFDPPVMIEVSRPIITVTINRPFFSLKHARDLQDAVNDKPWMQMDKRTVRCIGVEGNSAFENKVSFWVVTYTFALKYDTWDIRTLDAGFAELVTDDHGAGPVDEWRKILDPFGQPVTEPVPLNGAGRKLTPGDPENYLTWRVYREVDFKKLVV